MERLIMSRLPDWENSSYRKSYIFFNQLFEKLKMYYVTDGIPEPVLMRTGKRDISAMQEALLGVIYAHERDFVNYPDVSVFPKISMIWKSIPSQPAGENKEFLYKAVKESACP